MKLPDANSGGYIAFEGSLTAEQATEMRKAGHASHSSNNLILLGIDWDIESFRHRNIGEIPNRLHGAYINEFGEAV